MNLGGGDWWCADPPRMFQVWDHDSLSSDDVIGSVRIPLREFHRAELEHDSHCAKPGVTVRRQLTLSGANRGELEITAILSCKWPEVCVSIQNFV